MSEASLDMQGLCGMSELVSGLGARVVRMRNVTVLFVSHDDGRGGNMRRTCESVSKGLYMYGWSLMLMGGFLFLLFLPRNMQDRMQSIG